MRAAPGRPAMIGAVLDQVQKLFGRAFLIAAFVPSLLAVASAVGLWGGLATLRETVLGWTRQGFQEATFTLLALLALVYLLAYVAYGIRSALHRLYQGDWVVWPLTALAVPLTARARRELRAADAALEEATLALDDPAWCLEQTFAPSFTPLVLHRDEARQRLNHSRDAYTMLLLALDAGPRG